MKQYVEYFIRHHGREWRLRDAVPPPPSSKYLVSKSIDGDIDSTKNVYELEIGEKVVSCTCPSRQRPCKHVKMVERWLKLDLCANQRKEDFYFDPQRNQFLRFQDIEGQMKRLNDITPMTPQEHYAQMASDTDQPDPPEQE